MKNYIKKTTTLLCQKAKSNPVLLLAAIVLIIPDLLVRSVIPYPLFGEPFNTFVPLLFTICWVSLFLFLCRKLPAKTGRFVYLVFGLVIYTLAFIYFVYYKIFGQFFWFSSLGLAGEAGGYFKYALGFIDFPLVAITIVYISLLIFVTIKWQQSPDKQKVSALLKNFAAPVLLIVCLHFLLQPAVAGVPENVWDSWSKPQIVYNNFNDVNKSLSISGLYQFSIRDLWKTFFPQNQYSDMDFAEVNNYFEARPEPQENEYTNIFEGKNVIAVMMESMDDWMITEKYTPTIHYMMENGINFTDYHAPLVGSGYTFNSEFAFNTGYYTPQSVVTSVNFSKNSFPYSIAQLFRNKGYNANSFHYNTPEFYNRGIMHNALGYEKYHSFADYGMSPFVAQSDSNVLKNDEIYADMVRNQPFYDFVITYSAHVPYTYDDEKLLVAKQNHPELVNPQMHPETNNLILLARDTDDFFRELLTRLDRDGLLENTVIIGFADHYAYGFSDAEKLAEYSGDMPTRVPAFIYTPELAHKDIAKPMHTIDWLPTIINMFGLENNNCYIGNDIFDERHNGFIHFENARWYDGDIYFIPDQTTITPQTESRIKMQSSCANELLRINDIVIMGDYFKKR